MWVRPRSTDLKALRFSLEETDHLPPADLPGALRRIAVFGANIGLLAADLADRYPDARVLGVEADADNAELARRNTARFGDRCRIRHAAVWHSETELDMAWGEDAWGVDLSPNNPDTDTRRVTTVPAARVLSWFADGDAVDYLLINIETAWWDLLRHGHWTKQVRCLTVEIQDHYDEVEPLLAGLGFRTRMQRYDWGAFVTGVR